MASEKPSMILRSKTNLTDKEIKTLSDDEAWKIIYSIKPEKKQSIRREICFIGFNDNKKEELIDLAYMNHLKVVSSVTKNLEFLVCGENAGPKKIEKASEQGVQIISESEFFSMISV